MGGPADLGVDGPAMPYGAGAAPGLQAASAGFRILVAIRAARIGPTRRGEGPEELAIDFGRRLPER